jgi:signal peptidase II
MKLDKERTLPLLLTGIIILVDQVTKAIIAGKWPIVPPDRFVFIADVFNNDFLYIYHVRNKVIAFSLGTNIPEPVRPLVFILLPLAVLGVLLWYYLRSSDFTRLQRWATAGIIGGGMGNIIDRIFRPEGVVDFISVKFYGIFGFERWPTFNVADSSVVVCCILLFATIIVSPKKPREQAPDEQEA